MRESLPGEIKSVSLALLLFVVLAFSAWAWVSCEALRGLAEVVEDPGSPYSHEEDFAIYRPARDLVVQRVLSGAISVPNIEVEDNRLVTLGPDEPFVSWDGNEIIMANIGGKTCVFFYISRSFGEYVGFLWVPAGTDPAEFRDVGEPGGGFEKYDEHWFLVWGA